LQTIEVGETTEIEVTGGGGAELGFAPTPDTGSDDNVLTLPSFSTTVLGREAGRHTINTTVFDSVGGQHTMSVIFMKDATVPFAWNFEVQVDGGRLVPTSGRTGSVSFNNDGSLASFPATPITFTPAGAQEIKITLDAGAPNSFNGLFQFTGASTAVAGGQDGFGQGNLTQITIDKGGTVVGSYTNGTTRELARLIIAIFNNPAGLTKESNNFFSRSLASGDPIIREPLNGTDTAIAANTLEASNVDLSKELTDMIVAQRGFQANARVIRTSEEILDEAVNLVR
ncbi:MAG: flagellar hook-basal body complex protein, partial [Candidatus Latescibacteria bacterium]|nr:flagellar hook-basal body complex protein [Candidatus Latescibacterota bacterium]